jgi:hypothetical protein
MKNLLIIITILLLVGCDKTFEANIKTPFEGSKITLNGVLEQDSVSFKLSKSLNPWGNYKEADYYVKNGKIWIQDENKNTIASLTSNDGYAFSKVGKMLKIGAKYKVYASAEGLKQVETDWLIITDGVKPTFSQESSTGFWNGNKLNILINDIENQHNYYSVARYGIFHAKKENLEFGVFDLKANQSCYSNRIFDDACFDGKQKTLEYGFLKEAYTNKGQVVFDTIQILFGTVNKDAYDLWNSLGYSAPDALIDGLNEPPPSYSNVKNGYGVVFTRNWSSYVLLVK